jgi:CheY-like chemotaxis protein
MNADRARRTDGWGPDDDDPVMRALRILAGGVAHDYNNLLGGILGYSIYLAGRADAGSKLQADLGRIREAAETAAELTRRLQRFAQRRQFRAVSVSLPTVVDAALAAIAGARPRGVAVYREIGADLPAIPGDPLRLQEALLELLRNAIEAIGGGGGTVRVRAEADARDGRDGVLLTVLDDGEGIAADQHDQIFVPFFTTRAATGHRGLGLPMAYGIVANHRGSLRISSAPGKGALVSVWLPAGPGDTIPAPLPAPEDAALDGSETILLVDDEPIVRAMINEVLKSYGYAVRSVESGMEALDMVRRHGGEIDLVLMDLSMPGKDGRQTCREIRDLAPGLPVLIATGSVQLGDLETRLAADGASGVVYKPFHADDLARQVRRILDQRPPPPQTTS